MAPLRRVQVCTFPAWSKFKLIIFTFQGFGAPATGGAFGSTQTFGGTSSSPFSSLNKPGGNSGGFQATATVSSGLSNWGQQPKLGTTSSPGQNLGFGGSTTPFNAANTSNNFGGGIGTFGSMNKPVGTTSPGAFGSGISRSATTPANLFGQTSVTGPGGGFSLMGQPQTQQQPAFGMGGTSGIGGGGFMSGFQSQQQSVGTGNPLFSPQQVEFSLIFRLLISTHLIISTFLRFKMQS